MDAAAQGSASSSLGLRWSRLKGGAARVLHVLHISNPASTLLNWVSTKHIWVCYKPLVAPFFPFPPRPKHIKKNQKKNGVKTAPALPVEPLQNRKRRQGKRRVLTYLSQWLHLKGLAPVCLR